MLRESKYTMRITVESADGDGTHEDEEFIISEDEQAEIVNRLEDSDSFLDFIDDDGASRMIRKSVIRSIMIEKNGRP